MRDEVLGEGPQRAEGADAGRTQREPVTTVGKGSGEGGGTSVAQVGVTGCAPTAVAAHGKKRGDDLVTRPQPGDPGTDLPHHATAFVAAHQREVEARALAEVIVGMA